MNKGSIINIVDKLIFFLLCVYALLACTEDLGSMPFVRAAALLGCMRFLIQPIKLQFHKKHIRYIAAFLGSLIFTIVIDGGNYKEGLRFIWHDYLATMLPFLVTLLYIKKEQVNKLVLCLIISLGLTSAYGLWEGLHGIERVWGWAGGYMQLGGVLILVVPLVVVLLSKNSLKTSRYRPIWAVVLVLSIPVVFFNATRIAWIALLVIIPFILLSEQKNNKKVMSYTVVLIALFVLIGTVLPASHDRIDNMFNKSYQPNSERILMWHSAEAMFLDHPLTGLGLGNYKAAYYEKYISPAAKEQTVHAHSNIMHLLATTGILGATAYLFLFGYFLVESFSTWRKENSVAAQIFFFATIGFFIQGLTDYNIGFIGVVCKVYWLMLALYLIASENVKMKER